MIRPIPKSSQKRLLRLISARADIDYAESAWALFMATEELELRYHALLSFVISYARPFTENKGIGSLNCEYPDYPDHADPAINAAHERLLALRNRFFGHSTIEGLIAVLLAPNSVDPGTGRVVHRFSWNVAKREFPNVEHAKWLKRALDALRIRVDADLSIVLSEVGPAYLQDGDAVYLDTGHETFDWNQP